MNRQVIILDDQPEAALALEEHLRVIAPHLTPSLYSNPSLALNLIEDWQTVELLFLDISMPGMDGFQFLSQARFKGFMGHVIFTTSHDEFAIKAIRQQAVDYLLKPIDREELSDAIRRWRKLPQKKSDVVETIRNWKLSKREKQVLRLMQRALSSEEIGQELFISKNTVDKHRSHILEKASCRNTQELLSKLG